MKIVIHGTKGGYHIFTPERVSGLIDVRPDFNKVAAIGQQAYAINFNSDKVIFSKYRIIRDVIGEKRMGNIAFSVVITTKKLSGTDVKTLLDELSNEYCSKYIMGDNLNNVREDWTFVKALTTEYESRLLPISSDDTKNIQQGIAEAAFVYYSTDDELQKYFDAPYQEEYYPFRQVFFVKNDLNAKPENPLNALRHNPSSNLTGQVDLENPEYELRFSENTKNGERIEVRVNGVKRNTRNKIRRKADLEIIYTKPYYQEIKKTGRWYEASLADFVIVDANKQTVSIQEVELSPKIKTITFDVKDGKSNLIIGAEITCEKSFTKETKKIINNEATFVGEELKDKWKVFAKKGDYLVKTDFFPETQNDKIVLSLEEQKIVTVTATDESNGDYIPKIDIQISTKRPPVGNEIEFVGDEIGKKWTIIISDRDKKYELWSTEFTPATDGVAIYPKLKKKQIPGGGSSKLKIYTVHPGEHGKLRDNQEYTSLRRDGSDVSNKIIPDKGYEFLMFELNNDILKAIYRKKEPFYKSSTFVAAIIVGVILLISFILIVVSHKSRYPDPDKPAQQSSDHAQEITQYCDGDELNEQKLREYKNTYCKENKPDYCNKIDSAIAIRMSLNHGKIEEAKGKLRSQSQNNLKRSIQNIDEKFKSVIGEAISKSASTMNLNQISDLIIKLQKILRLDINALKSENDCDVKIQEIDSLKLADVEVFKNIKTKINNKKEILKKVVVTHTDNNNATQPVTIDNPPPIIKTKPPVVSNTSQLEKDFWNLVHSGNDKKDAYNDLLKKNKNPIGDDIDIISLLKKICKSSDSFKRFKNIPEIDRKNAKSLTDINNALTNTDIQ